MAARGNVNAAQKLGTTEKPIWGSWKTKDLASRCIRFIESQCILSKGRTFNQRIKAAEWQKDWLDEVFGNEITASILSISRANGKTTFIGAVATWALFDEAVAEAFGGQPIIPVVAPVLKQAERGIYGAALSFVRANPELRSRALLYAANGNMRMVCPGNHYGELFPLADNVEHLQGLDPMLSLVDEIGFVSIETWSALQLAAGKRPRSLTLGIGTRAPGEKPNALDHLTAQYRQYGDSTGLHLISYEAPPGCALDDPQAWHAANPALREGYLGAETFVQDLQLLPEAEFRCFRLNQKVAAIDAWLGPEGPQHWDSTKTDYQLDREQPCYIGVDKSAKGDLSAVVTIQQCTDREGWFAQAKVFYPVGGAINHKEVKEHIRRVCEDYKVEAIGYDPKYFVEGSQELEDEGLPMQEVPQTRERMIPAYTFLYQLIVTEQLYHSDDPVFRTHVLGAEARYDESGGFMLAKSRSKTKIDAVVALAIALYTSGAAEPEPVFWIR